VTKVFAKRSRLRRSSRGQSLVEMALILPFLLAFAGAATDFARAYQASMTLESGVRNAAEYVATNSATSTAAATDARRVVCLEATTVPGFTAGTGANPNDNCTAPAVTISGFALTTVASGDQMGSVHVQASVAFNTLVPYPFLPHDGWTLTADSTYSVLRNR
jgi:Flp pilus assembly protein TadG